MKNFIIPAILFLILTTGCKQPGPSIIPGSIIGPDRAAENSVVEFTLQTQGTLIHFSYLWTVTPSDAGSIENNTLKTIRFHAGNVDEDSDVSIHGRMIADNCRTDLITQYFVIENLDDM